jgi:tRNA(Ile)-lysidine synthase
MLERLREHLERTRLIPEGARILVGYSGGPDSTCLLHLLHRLNLDVVAAHLHHGQRPEADEELRRCEQLCNDLGVPFAAGHADVPRLAKDLKIGLEEAGRHARYEFFRQAAFRLQCPVVATAHTRDDHVETVLLNLTRGSGLAGLSGIPARRGEVIRPLLPFSRAETRAYCTEHGLWTHDDPANTDLAHSRVRIRQSVLPELRAINPQADVAIERLAEIVDEETRFLDGMAAAGLERSEIPLNGDLKFLTEDVEAAFDLRRLSHLPPTLLRRALRLAASALGAALDREQTVAVERGIRSNASGSVTAEGGEVALEWTSERLTVRRLVDEQPFRHPLVVPGEVDSDMNWRIEAWPTEDVQVDQPRATLLAALDRQKVKGPLYFRNAAPGDTIQPLGFSGSRKLADLLSEMKLTIAARKRLPIVCDMIGPVWAPGVCLSERVRTTNETRHAIAVRFSSTAAAVETGQGREAYLNPDTSPEPN